MTNNNSNAGMIPDEHRLPIRVVVAKRKFGHTSQQQDNERAEQAYYKVLKVVKQLLHVDEPIVFEKAYTQDNSQNAYSIHAFISNSFYLYLECDHCYIYQVEYAFHNCEHDQTIRGLLNNAELPGRLKEVTLIPGFTSFYHELLGEPIQYVHKLTR